ncbi:hypothetical protein ACFQ4Z_18680 [Oceanobacillus oncorhynchi subsp. oncorhynchi]|uniref:hypothetical protein n=1 Tax=Oceanobacillus oncorhynchi TaxID=545501 RepID=UPI00362A6930
MYKTARTAGFLRTLLLFIAFAVLMIGCSSNSDENNEDSSAAADQNEETEDTAANGTWKEATNDESEGSDLYHEMGETFEIEGYSSGVPAEITVNEIWIEDGDDHQAFIEESIASPSEDDAVAFVDYTVENIGDRSINMGDVIPEYAALNGSFDLDLSYPENNTFTDQLASFQESLDEGESMDLVGAVAADEKSLYAGALMWNFMQDIPEIVFHTPQDERRDQIGTYDIGEDMYLNDYGEDTFFKVNISNVEINEGNENLDLRDETESVLAVDMTFENQLDEDVTLYHKFPQPHVEGLVDGQGANSSVHLVIDGQPVEDLYEGPEGKIGPGETLEGTVYYEIVSDDVEDVQLLFPNPSLLTFPDYGMWVDYNLEG